MSYDAETVATYDNKPAEFAEYFAGYGARVKDIEKALELAGNPAEARVVEIGCGDGRDAAEIIPRVGWYEGFDPSEGLLELAEKRGLPTEFVQADALSYKYPQNLDVVFAFASLLHIDRYDLNVVFGKIQTALRAGGIAFVSLKETNEYHDDLQHDRFGNRLFYYYDVATVLKAAGLGFKQVYDYHDMKGNTPWFSLALQKV